MKTLLLLTSSAILAVAVAVTAQQPPPVQPASSSFSARRSWTDDDLDKLMKQIGPAANTLRKLVDDKSGDAAEAHADTLQHLFGEVEDFFDARHIDDAEEWADEASTYAHHVENAAESKDFAKGAEHLKLMMGTCQACHAKYRERAADGTYRLKTPQ